MKKKSIFCDFYSKMYSRLVLLSGTRHLNENIRQSFLFSVK